MLDHFPFYLILVVSISMLIMLAQKIKVAYPVLLVLAGLGVSFIPAVPTLSIDPEMIFVIFLPPLLYEASWAISWKELWRWRRIIGSFAFVVVFLTAMSVAFVANHFIPGFSLALGFLLGGIVSPPDAVSAGTILKFVKVPKRFSSILEGESLLNDASSLIIFRFALVAVATGQFVWYEAVGSFVWMVVGGLGIGLAVGFGFMKMHKYLPTDANIDIVLSLVAPYAMYILAEETHSSGVLAVVSGGLWLSTHRNRFLSSTSRLRGLNVWESFTFILNGLVFTLIGLELPEITQGLAQEGVELPTAIGYGLIITGVLVVGRVIAAYGAVVTTLIARNFITVADTSNPGIRGPFLLAWSGMRGVVSLAAALSIPIRLEDGTAFPHRNLILFITFVVILLTLVVQGLTLPFFIKRIHIPDPDHSIPEEQEERILQRELSRETLIYLKENHAEAISRHSMLSQLHQRLESSCSSNEENPVWNKESAAVYHEVLNYQREWLLKKNRENMILDEDIVRRQLQRVDLEEEKLRFL
ncbi:MAG: Na+/H+ antiporter [Flavobacterium sp.]|uniref:Na+/H+ antiporter n=1 Tax=Flavobacterium sp. TaxID=239 RepID=UPI001217748E|nr:Na+/H+ antiporter [Flavobacterium sp.]RZJ63374.1 MAG: Na+/H+ antiporter [Flavobacterium sp.]